MNLPDGYEVRKQQTWPASPASPWWLPRWFGVLAEIAHADGWTPWPHGDVDAAIRRALEGRGAIKIAESRWRCPTHGPTESRKPPPTKTCGECGAVLLAPAGPLLFRATDRGRRVLAEYVAARRKGLPDDRWFWPFREQYMERWAEEKEYMEHLAVSVPLYGPGRES